MLALKHMESTPGKEGVYDTFFAGLLGGYLAFGRRSKKGHVSSVSKQIVIFGKLVSFGFDAALSGSADASRLDYEFEFWPRFCKPQFNQLPLSIRPRLPLPRRTLHQALRRPDQEPRALETNRTRCMARLRGAELGKCYVAVQMVSRYGAERTEE